MKDNIIKDFNLPKYIKGKSFAEASKAIDKKFEGRSDKISMDTKNALLERLANAQEHVKEMEGINNPDTNEAAQGGFQQGFNSYMGLGTTALELGQTAFGDSGIDSSDAIKMDPSKIKAGNYAAQGAMKGAKAGSSFGPWGALIGGVVGAGAGLLGGKKAKKDAQEARKNYDYMLHNKATEDKAYGGYDNRYFFGGMFGGGQNQGNPQGQQMMQGMASAGQQMDNNYNPSNTPMDEKTKQQMNSWEQGKDAVGSAFPIAGMFRGVEKLGKQGGQAVAGNKGGDFMSGFLDPAGANMSNKDANFGQKALTFADPVMAGIVNMGQKKKARAKAAQESTFSSHNAATRDYALGGTIKDPINREAIDATFANLPISDDASLAGAEVIEPTQQLPKFGDTKTGQALGKAGKWLGENAGDIMRYAPVAMNAFQLAKLGKPEVEHLQRLNNRYRRDPFDVNTLTNKIENQYAGLARNLANASGGDTASLRANLLGAQVNKTQAISDAFARGEQINRADKIREQEFNLGIDRFNVGQSNLEQDINAKNRAAHANEKSKLLAAIGTDLGNIGKEEVTKKQAKEIFGYDWKGNYKKKNPKASKAEVNEAYKKAVSKKLSDLDLEQAYGGYLKKK